MKKLFLILFCLTNLNIVLSQNLIPKEQIAFDYFFDKIFIETYQEKISKLEFTGFTEADLSSFIPFYDSCLDEQISKSLYEALKENKNKNFVKINLDELKKTKVVLKKRKLKFRINIFKVSKIKDLYYVQIEIVKKKHNIDSFYLVINEDSKVINWCKTGVTI